MVDKSKLCMKKKGEGMDPRATYKNHHIRNSRSRLTASEQQMLPVHTIVMTQAVIHLKSGSMTQHYLVFLHTLYIISMDNVILSMYKIRRAHSINYNFKIWNTKLASST